MPFVYIPLNAIYFCSDVIYAPIFGVIMSVMFGYKFGVLGFIEEAVPFLDVIPSATIAYLLTGPNTSEVVCMERLKRVMSTGRLPQPEHSEPNQRTRRRGDGIKMPRENGPIIEEVS
tara:strand:+ start:319 stop:669 length:351 start_codon:yes stop_codon:yes gene_type:complete